MRDLFLVGILALMFLAAFKRPFIMTLAYIYVDLVQPQEFAYYLLSSVPVSLIFAVASVLFYLALDRNKRGGMGALQWLMLLFLGWITLTTIYAQVPDSAWLKWDSAWKAIGFAIFLPFVLNTRVRFNAAILVMVVCVGSLLITGGMKTVLGGGGYGTLNILVDRNVGLYEGSTLSAVAISLIPLIIYAYKHCEFIPKNRLTWLFAAGLVFAALLIPVGTEARTGLVCIAVLGFLMWLGAKRKIMYVIGVAVAAIIALPLLPSTFTGRMETIETYDEDTSASTRLAVWAWTWNFVQEHPLGGGFGAFRLNEIKYQVKKRTGEGNVSSEETVTVTDRARAYHSAYFEVLGEQGYPGLAIYLAMYGVTFVQLRRLYKRFRDHREEHWIADAARALGFTFIVYSVGSLFVGIAFQSTQYFLFALTASLVQVAARRTVESKQGFVPRSWKATAVPAQ